MGFQPGYDALAELYAETFPAPFSNPLQRHAIGAFIEHVDDSTTAGAVLDVGCGPGHVTAELTAAGLDTIGVDPSTEMVRIARSAHPGLRFVLDDARLTAPELADTHVAAIVARFSLIHVPPDSVPEVLTDWAARMPRGGVVMVAGQSTDVDEIVEFDHVVTPGWRWHPDRMSAALATAGFDEEWRTVKCADDAHRFPEFHLLAVRL
ncbi:class I SAM-dependent methyltransferase [Gordonia sp. zg691]|uniref:Class I SAM-dependent methyltransferase n=1 Tax=Gordonia jinghuaiqii TaxID=2758710 RepID=A0A7D7M174_9ACTN|nr:class I SAM-dependent methyltransferase [Gordonia jinghuaiqii]MBD0859626.1 class I SAM-dependent methyltransferase [Gordonia jinghuaiqii]MCR5976853.1 methyltransferase domain-containing protein [Gordonia jinghuaiqii]QMT03974.1 class I SAM-dependent methyltransferase [Gordonia jinghuaiqii]